MASAPFDSVTGVVDAGGRLTAADPALLRLQEEAGARLGQALAVPQLAAIARLARRLGVPVSRAAVAGSNASDLDLWVRAEPAGEAVRLTIDDWAERPANGPRWWGRRDAPAEDVATEAPDDRFVTDADLKVVELGAALARRLGCDERPGVPLTRLFKLEADDDGDMPMLSAIAQRMAFDGQRAFPRDGDAALTLALSGAPLPAPAGQFVGFEGRARAATAALSQPAGQGATGIDDLLRQPLDQIITQAHAISQRAEGPLRSDYAAYASDIATAGRHLLDVLRSMGEEALPTHDRIDLSRTAAEAAGLVQPQAGVRGVRIVVQGANGIWARGQPRAVTQILVNLIGNAARFSPDGGVVRVTLSNGREAAVTVSDDGPGIAAGDQQRIFERFEQAEPRGEGAGLGLAISRRLAQSMGGDIALVSVPGEGASFTLRLPLAGS